jgi:hypothetical protein
MLEQRTLVLFMSSQSCYTLWSLHQNLGLGKWLRCSTTTWRKHQLHPRDSSCYGCPLNECLHPKASKPWTLKVPAHHREPARMLQNCPTAPGFLGQGTSAGMRFLEASYTPPNLRQLKALLPRDHCAHESLDAFNFTEKWSNKIEYSKFATN